MARRMYDAADSIAAAEQRLVKLKDKQVRDLGRQVIKLMGTDARPRQLAGLIRLGLERFSAEEVEAAGREDYPGRETTLPAKTAPRPPVTSTEESNFG